MPAALSALDQLDAAALRAWRRAHGYTQRELAAALGLFPTTLARWETGVVPLSPRLVALALEALERRGGPEPPEGTAEALRRLLAPLGLTAREATVLGLAVGERALDAAAVARLPALLRDRLARQPQLAARWAVDADALLRRIEAAGPIVWAALAVAIAAWWADPTPPRLGAVGLAPDA